MHCITHIFELAETIFSKLLKEEMIQISIYDVMLAITGDYPFWNFTIECRERFARCQG